MQVNDSEVSKIVNYLKAQGTDLTKAENIKQNTIFAYLVDNSSDMSTQDKDEAKRFFNESDYCNDVNPKSNTNKDGNLNEYEQQMFKAYIKGGLPKLQQKLTQFMEKAEAIASAIKEKFVPKNEKTNPPKANPPEYTTDGTHSMFEYSGSIDKMLAEAHGEMERGALGLGDALGGRGTSQAIKRYNK